MSKYCWTDAPGYIYVDSETWFNNPAANELKYQLPNLRLLTYRVNESKTCLIDVWKYKEDPWAHIRELMEQGYCLVAHNGYSFDYQSSLTNHNVPAEHKNWITKFLVKGQCLDTLYLEKIINGHLPNVTQDIFEREETEEGDDEVEGKTGYSLADLVLRYKKIKLEKKYQDWRYYVSDYLKPEIREYAVNDVEHLPYILGKQLEKVKELGIEEFVDLHNKLGLTVWAAKHYGIPIDSEYVAKVTKDYNDKKEKLEKDITETLPFVKPTKCGLIKIYLDSHWLALKGVGGISRRLDMENILKGTDKPELARFGESLRAGRIKAFKEWEEKYITSHMKPVNLNAPAQKLEAFNAIGIEINDTKESTIKDYIMHNECKVLEDYLKFNKVNTLLNKTLTKMIPGKYVHPDGTAKPTFNFMGTANSRSSCKEPNLQQTSADLKAIINSKHGDLVRIDYDLSAVELAMVLNDFPDKELLKLALDPAEDLHIWNACKFFGGDYKEALKKHRAKDPEVKKLRNAAKTVIYFLIYKTPADPTKNFVSGRARLQTEFKDTLAWDLDDATADSLILIGEEILKPWTDEKRKIDVKIKELGKQQKNLIAFKQVHSSYFRLRIMEDRMYTPQTFKTDPDTGLRKKIEEYVNARSLYSVRIAGKIAVAAKCGVQRIQEQLYNNFGLDDARLVLFVHDSFCVYCKPDLVEDVSKIMIHTILKTVYDVAKFEYPILSIEGGVYGTEERKYTWINNKAVEM